MERAFKELCGKHASRLPEIQDAYNSGRGWLEKEEFKKICKQVDRTVSVHASGQIGHIADWVRATQMVSEVTPPYPRPYPTALSTAHKQRIAQLLQMSFFLSESFKG
jgi:hypothetical protein